MRTIDPQLQRLREVEARIAFAEYHLREQEAAAARLAAGGLGAALAAESVRSVRDALLVLHRRHDELIVEIEGGRRAA